MFMMPRGFQISTIKPSFLYIKFDINDVVYYGINGSLARPTIYIEISRYFVLNEFDISEF